MIVDLSGSGPQALGPINATLASAGSAVSYAIMACADEPIPANAGCYRPVTVIAPEGLIVNARHPAPVANRLAVTHRLATTLLGALHKAVPDRTPPPMNPYYQLFCGEEFFCHKLPFDRSSFNALAPAHGGGPARRADPGEPGRRDPHGSRQARDCRQVVIDTTVQAPSRRTPS